MSKETLIAQMQPIYDFFKDIAAIPHGSGNEAGLCNYIEEFAKKRSLEYHRDNADNIIVWKNATNGSSEYLGFQAHIDMVCEKNSGTDHDFEKDALSLIITDDGKLTADGTTLGADDGIGVATMLALLDGNISHPPIECLFTTGEEIGFLGADALDPSLLRAKRIINLDSEDWGKATVGCCGGITVESVIPAEYEAINGELLKITISGLAGGHSGIDIDKHRCNAVKAMGAILGAVGETSDFRIAEIYGGNKDNAIPRECTVVIAVDSENISAVNGTVAEASKAVAAQLSDDDQGFCVDFSADASAERVFTKEYGNNILTFINSCPNGVISRNDETGFIMSSANLASVKPTDNGIRLVCSIRSIREDDKHEIAQIVKDVADKSGGSYTVNGDYCGWDYNPDSTLKAQLGDAYKKLFGGEIIFETIHAGLECGLFTSRIEGLDIISVGPTVVNCHTPDEYLEIETCEKLWQLMLELCKTI